MSSENQIFVIQQHSDVGCPDHSCLTIKDYTMRGVIFLYSLLQASNSMEIIRIDPHAKNIIYFDKVTR